MQVFSGGQPLAEKEFFSTAKEAFGRGQQALAENPEADEVRIGVDRPKREGPKKRGVGVTRGRGNMPKAKRKAQKKARRANR